MIRGVIFDVGGTLIWKNGKRFLKANAWVAANHLRSQGHIFDYREFANKLEKLQKDTPKADESLRQLNTTKEHITELVHEYNIPITEARLDELSKAFFTPEIAGAVALPGIHKVLAKLQGKIKLGVLSNTRSQILIEGILKELDMDVFDIVATSSRTGYRKPSPKFFEAILGKWNFDPEEIVMIGDLPHKDVAGAKALGIKSIWINIDSDAIDKYGADAIAEKPSDILEILESWGLDFS